MNKTAINFTEINFVRINTTKINLTGITSDADSGIPPIPGEDTYILKNAVLLANGKPLLLEDGTPLVLT